MNKVLLGDVVKRVKNKVDKNSSEFKYYVAGEHFDNGEICISKRGEIEGSTIGPAFHMSFKPGDVLLMSRNPHLRKAGVVNFEGICSDVSYVCETKNELVLKQRFLPFIFQSDDFWCFAEANKKGSTNFFLNWSDFEKYEFNLPNIEVQEKLSELLWAANTAKDTYNKLAKKTDELIKAQFIEMFGDIQNEKCLFSVKPLGEICELKSGGTPPRKNPEYFRGTIPWITTVALGKNYISSEDANEYITEEAIKNSATKLIAENSLLFGTRVGVGKCSINKVPMCTNQDIMSITKINQNEYNLIYLKKVLESYAEFFNSQKRGATIKGITANLLRSILVPVAPIEVQNEFAEFVKKAESSKEELQQTILGIQSVMNSIMKQSLRQ